MRSYPHNSPEAAARLVALAMLADGHASRVELAALEGLPLPEHIGVSLPQFGAVVQALCEDLLNGGGTWSVSCIDDTMIDALLDEVSDTTLQHKVLLACAAVTEADAHMADGEMHLMARTRKRWPGIAGQLTS